MRDAAVNFSRTSLSTLDSIDYIEYLNAWVIYIVIIIVNAASTFGTAVLQWRGFVQYNPASLEPSELAIW